MRQRTEPTGVRTTVAIMIMAAMFSLRVFAAETGDVSAETEQNIETVLESEESVDTAEVSSEDFLRDQPTEQEQEPAGSEEIQDPDCQSSVGLPVAELPASELIDGEQDVELSTEEQEGQSEGNEEQPSDSTVLTEDTEIIDDASGQGNEGGQVISGDQEMETDPVNEEEENPIPAAFRVTMDGTLDRIHFITLNTNGDSSDATLIESNGLYGLIDASNPSGVDNKYPAYTVADANGQNVVNYLKSLDITHLSFVLATHAHSDHTGGIPDIVNAGLVDDTTVYIYKDYYNKDEEKFGTSEDAYWHNDYYVDRALEAMQSKNAVLLDTSAPQQGAMDMIGAVLGRDSSGDAVGDNLSFSMGDFLIRLYNLYKVSSSNENLNSIVTTVQKDDARAVLMADMQLEAGMEDRVVSAIVRNDGTARTDVLKVGHHGYMGSTGVNTVETLNPKYAVVSTRSTVSTPENKAYYNYLMGMLGTKIYRTSEARGALVADFDNNMVSLQNRDLASGRNLGLVEWRARLSNGWQQWIADASGKSSYLYITNGRAIGNQWYQVDGKWYYFDPNYLMHTGWKQLGSTTYYLDPSGVMHKGWLQEGGKWYYLDGYGILQKNKTMAINGSNYTFDTDGALRASWVCINSGWYYLQQDGSVTKGWAKIGSNWHYFNSNGVMQKNMWTSSGGKKYYVDGYGIMMTGPGWKQIGGNWYYLQEDGAVTTGLLTIGSNTYYLDAAGVMQKNKWVTVDGKQYYLDGYGIAAKGPGWKQVSGKWYYLNEDGSAATGLLTLGSNTYYLDAAGVMQKNQWITVEGKLHYFDGYGILVKETGWKQINGKWYYLNEDGSAATGLLTLGSNTYYLDAAGVMQKNQWITVDGKQYYLDGYGILVKETDWKQVGGSWYYLNEDGSAATGWKQIGASWYYFSGSGVMQKNTWALSGGKRYYVDGYGIMMTGPGWKQIGGNWYYLNAGGDAATGLAVIGSNTYYMDASGVMQKRRWVTADNKLYYLDGYGIVKKGPGWNQIDGSWYYLNEDGSAATGLFSADGNTYYMNASGVMQKNLTITIGDVTYHFDGYGIGTIISQ